MDKNKEFINGLIRTLTGERKVITPNKLLVEDLGVDSLMMFELTVAIEDEFDVLIPVSSVASIRTVQDLYNAVNNLHQYAIATPENASLVS